MRCDVDRRLRYRCYHVVTVRSDGRLHARRRGSCHLSDVYNRLHVWSTWLLMGLSEHRHMAQRLTQSGRLGGSRLRHHLRTSVGKFLSDRHLYIAHLRAHHRLLLELLGSVAVLPAMLLGRHCRRPWSGMLGVGVTIDGHRRPRRAHLDVLRVVSLRVRRHLLLLLRLLLVPRELLLSL